MTSVASLVIDEPIRSPVLSDAGPPIAPALRSWVDSANDDATDFPLQNLPFGTFRRAGVTSAPRIGVAIGDMVLDLRQAGTRVQWPSEVGTLMSFVGAGDLNDLAARPVAQQQIVRQALSMALAQGSQLRHQVSRCLVHQAEIAMCVPCVIGDHTEFLSDAVPSHLTRPRGKEIIDPPGIGHFPSARHGRASIIGVSGQKFKRPQSAAFDDRGRPQVRTSARMDYAAALGIWIGGSSLDSDSIDVDEGERHAFGLGLVNNWFAGDFWDPLSGASFQARNFATTVSPWIVTMEALEPFRCPPRRTTTQPRPADYLVSARNNRLGGLAITIDAYLETPLMRELRMDPQFLTSFRATDAPWSVAQLVAHHAVTGCRSRSGDLMSLPLSSARSSNGAGSMHDLTKSGATPLTLRSGEIRTFIDDGDAIVLRAYCDRPGARRIGFGECRGTLLARTGTAKRRTP